VIYLLKVIWKGAFMSEYFNAKRFEEYFAASELLKKSGTRVLCFESLDSTNSEARRYALSGGFDKSETVAFLAFSQSAGRGRMGRSFFSPAYTGLYLTLLLDASDMPSEKMLCLTPAAAVAVLRTARTLGVENARIKWVNDIQIGGKKACGILAESFAVGERRFVAVGIGINLYTESFGEELSSIATSFFDGNAPASDREQTFKIATERLCAELCGLKKYIDNGDFSYMSEYREGSAVIGREISYIKDGKESLGVALGVDDFGRLSVRGADGEVSVLSGGEITLRVRVEN